MNLKQAKRIWSLGLVLLICGLISCSPVDDDTDAGDVGPAGAAILALSTNTFTIESNAESFAVITATVLDDNNAAMEGVTVQFATDSGMLNLPTAVTDENGRATVQLQSGPLDRTNRNITITATVIGVESDSTVIQVTGTTVTPSLDTTSVQVGTNETATMTVAVKDAGQNALAGVTVQVTENGSKSTGTVAIASGSSEQAVTGNDGTCAFEWQGTSAGEVVMTISAAGVTVDTDAFDGANIQVQGGQSFRIQLPGYSPTDADPASISIDDTEEIEVTVPEDEFASSDTKQVLFSTTLGGMYAATPTVGELAVANGARPNAISVTVTSGNPTATAYLNSSSAGTATVQAAMADDLSPSDSVTVVVAAGAETAAAVSLQGSASTVAPSRGDLENAITLTATVTNDEDEPVQGATVVFSIDNPTGYGEYLAPVARETNQLGEAETTFTSGTEGSDTQGVKVWAQVFGTSIQDDFDVVIGGEPGSIMIGRGTTIESIQSDTAYRQPMTVVVADAGGNPVSGTQVTLSAWPSEYYDGYWVKVGDVWVPVYTAGAKNEDVNENLRLDTGEDTLLFEQWRCWDLDGGGGNNDPFILTSEAAVRGGNGDGILTPPNSAAGTLPPYVVTDEDGKAQFDLVYAKASAVWVEARVTATTSVLGTETKADLYMTLPYLSGDGQHLDSSPFDLRDPIQLAVQAQRDLDGDGHIDESWDHCPFTGTDCDDTDPDINPDVEEICGAGDGGVDSNCDGDPNDGCLVYGLDDDGDGYGDDDPATFLYSDSTTAPAGYVDDTTDCDDTTDTISPGRNEICADGIDNDCDGDTDEPGCV